MINCNKKLFFLKNFLYLFKRDLFRLILELKFEFNFIPFSRLSFISPSFILISSKFPNIFFNSTSFLSAKKLKFVFVKFKLPKNSACKSFIVPFAIKSLNKPSSSKNISISVINLPFLILLFKKLLKLDGLINLDSLFN